MNDHILVTFISDMFKSVFVKSPGEIYISHASQDRMWCKSSDFPVLLLLSDFNIKWANSSSSIFSRYLLLSLSWRRSGRRVLIRKGKTLKSRSRLRISFPPSYILDLLQFDSFFLNFCSKHLTHSFGRQKNLPFNAVIELVNQPFYKLQSEALLYMIFERTIHAFTCELLTSVNL